MSFDDISKVTHEVSQVMLEITPLVVGIAGIVSRYRNGDITDAERQQMIADRLQAYYAQSARTKAALKEIEDELGL